MCINTVHFLYTSLKQSPSAESRLPEIVVSLDRKQILMDCTTPYLCRLMKWMSLFYVSVEHCISTNRTWNSLSGLTDFLHALNAVCWGMFSEQFFFLTCSMTAGSSCVLFVMMKWPNKVMKWIRLNAFQHQQNHKHLAFWIVINMILKNCFLKIHFLSLFLLQ